jgi:molecular chaperone DnaK
MGAVGRLIGIDLGTTNSCVAVLEGGEATVIHNQEGGRTTPSVVAFDAKGEPVVGAPAKRQAVTNPRATLFGIKRLIGRRFNAPEVVKLRETMPFEVVASTNGDAWVRVADKVMAPPEVSALVLAKMKKVAEDYLGEAVDEAIVTVPAYFDDVQRQATKDAGQIAGLRVRSILNEPTAAALAFGVHQGKNQRIVVVDLGGGTFDVSVLHIEDGVFQVLATSGDTLLGGDDFDRVVIEHLAAGFRADTGADLSGDAVALQRLKEAAERAKIELSSSLTTDINLPFLAVMNGAPQHMQRELKRSELEGLCRGLLERLDAPCLRALADARMTPADLDQVVLVGGMTRMPAVQARVEGLFGKKPSKNVNPDESVAIGAALQSAIMDGRRDDIVLLDVTPHALGIKVAGGRVSTVVARNTTVPTRETKVFSTTEDNQDFVTIEVVQGDPDKPAENRVLGRFVLGDLPRAPRGALRVEVSFTLDADGILHVTAQELTTGKAASVTLQAGSGLTQEDVARLAAERREARGV